MLKKVFMVVLSLGFMGGLAFYGFPEKNQQSVILPVQNHIGDLRFNFEIFESVTVSQQPSHLKDEERGESSGLTTAVKKQNAMEGSGRAKAIASDQAETPSLQSGIEQKYLSRLQALSGLYEGKLNGLVASAMLEINSVKNTNQKVDIKLLFNKYYSEAKSLEAQCDSQVYSLLEAFENELKANSLPLDMAVSARATYESRKVSRASQLTAVNP